MGYRLPGWSGLGGLGVLIRCRRLSLVDGGLGSRRGQKLEVSESSFGAEGLLRWIEALAHGFLFMRFGTRTSLEDYNPVRQQTQVQGLPSIRLGPGFGSVTMLDQDTYLRRTWGILCTVLKYVQHRIGSHWWN